jgi:hypothetical protein
MNSQIKTISFIPSILLLIFCAVAYTFLASEVTKVDVSDSVVVPENYENLLVLDVTIPSAKNLKKDTLLHNGQTGSSPGDALESFSSKDWYSDQNLNQAFEGNQTATDNEAIIFSSDNILDASDVVKNTGTAFIKPFKYSSGVYEQYIDNNHSGTYTSGEAVVRTSTTGDNIYQGAVIRNGLADMTQFSSYIKFTDGIQPILNPPKYQDGEAIIVDIEPLGILSSVDTILKPGNAGLKAFPNDIAYLDSDKSNRFSTDKAIINDKGTIGKLDALDLVLKSGKANLKPLGTNEYYADNDKDGEFDSGEMVITDTSGDLKVQDTEINIPGFANLRAMSGEGLLFSDDNKNTVFNANELIVRNNGNPEILEPSDAIVKSGKADLRAFTSGIEKFIDANKNGIYDDGECIIHDSGTIGKIEPNDIEKLGLAILQSFSGNNYLYTDANNDGKYAGDPNGEAILHDTNTNGLIDNDELVTSGYAPIMPFSKPLWFIDANENNAYNNGESIVMSNDGKLSTDDVVVASGSAFLTAFPEGIIKWAEVNNNNKYDEDEMIVSSADDIISVNEVVKPGLCNLKPFPAQFNGYLYSDDNNNDNYSNDELIIASSDGLLDSNDIVIRQGKAILKQFLTTSNLYIDTNNNNAFDQNEAIIKNNDPIANVVLLDSSDEVVKTGTVDAKSFSDDIVYIDQNNDGRFQGDSDGDVVWDKSGDLMSANDPDIIADQDEAMLNDIVGPKHLALDDLDKVIRPGVARLKNFANNYKYIDHYNKDEFSGSTANEAIIQDSDGILDSTDTVIVAGRAGITDFVDERFIDDNSDGSFTSGELIWRDSGITSGKLDPSDEIVKPGYASLLSMSDYKYTNDGINSGFTGAQAIINDKAPLGILSKNDLQIKYGTADVKNFGVNEKFVDCDGNGKYTDGEPVIYESGGTLIITNPGIIGNFTEKIRYIDSDNSGFYSASGSPLAKTDTEAIIADNGDKELNDGKLDGTGADKIIVQGKAKIKPIGSFASQLKPINPLINAFIDKNLNNQPDDYEILITDNNPTGILDPSDIIWGKINNTADDFYYWSGTQIMAINGSTLSPPNSAINAYIDSYNFGSLDNYEVLIKDNAPLGTLDSNDIVYGEIKNKTTKEWSSSLEDGLPWRLSMQAFGSQEKFLTSKTSPIYNGQPIINESTGETPNQWDKSDLMVYDGTSPRGINANWGQIKYIDNNHDGSYTLSECIIDLSLVPSGGDIVYPAIIVTEGMAGFGDFQPELKFCDQFPKDGIYETDEALINDANNNNMIDSGEIVSQGMVVLNELKSPIKYIDANHNGKFNGNEAIILDGGNIGSLDIGGLNGTDKIISSGEADITSFKRAEKYVDGNNNNAFDAGEAIVYDWFSPNFAGEFILAGNHVDKNGVLTYLPAGSRNRDCVIMNGEANRSAMIKLNDRPEQKYIDINASNSYNGFYDVWNGIDYEPIINSIDNQLNKGKLDGSGTDSVSASGYCFLAWNSEIKWSDSNHDNNYQDSEAIVYDAFNDGIIKTIGTGANDDKIIVPGNADLNDFQYMKYIDANSNNAVDFGTELTAKDTDQDNKLRNEEIGDSGLIPFLKLFASSDYRFCDWNKNGSFDSQDEPIIYTPIDPDILGKEDEIVATGSYSGLKGFSSQTSFIDYNHDNDYDSDEAIISGDGDQILEASDQIIISGKANSFDGTNIKYAGESYIDGDLIADTADNILNGSEVLTAGNVNLTEFSASDKYSDSNHNGRYDYKVYGTNFGEAIISDNGDNVIGVGEVKTSGYADLRTFDGTNFKYSDSGARDHLYNDGELMINDLNNDNKVDPSEIFYDGIADLKKFSSGVMFCDANNDGIYASSEALISSDDDILQSTDKVLAEGNANLHAFEQNLYRFADSDNNDTYSAGEAIIVESAWGTVDDILEKTDVVILEGTAGIKPFPSNFMFLDDSVDSGEYEEGEAIVNDLNGNSQLDTTDEIVTSGRASLKRFISTERYTDGGINANNSLYDADEAIIRDGNSDGKLSAGPLDGTGADAVLMPGKAGLRNFNNDELYVDANENAQYDGNEDIYRDEDGNSVVTGDGDDQLVYFVVENIGSADKSDLNVKLWADRDKDGQFEPNGDDSPSVKTLSADSSYNMWFEGSASSPPLSLRSNKSPIAYPMPNNQRFFVTIDTSANAVDGRDIQMRIPINGIKTLYALPSPSDSPILNAYKQFIDHANPTKAVITSPLENDTIYGQIVLSVDAVDSVAVGKVEFYDGMPDGIKKPIAIDDNGSPWEAVWDCSNAGFGEHTIYARVYDKTYQRPPKSKTINHYLDSQGVRVVVGIKHTITLSAGWNYVSLPVEPFNQSVPSFMASIGTKARSIWAYDAGTEEWLKYDLDGPGFLNDLTTVEAGVGYQIFMTGSAVFNIVGTLPNSTINLRDGWNFVGCNAQKSVSIIDAISSIMANHPSVWTIDSNGGWLGYDPENPPNDLSTIEPGIAYWIHVVGDCQWVIQ